MRPEKLFKHTLFTLEYEQEEDGRWLAEVPQLPGVLAYGVAAKDAIVKAEVLALRVMAEQFENQEIKPVAINFSLPAFDSYPHAFSLC